MCLLLGDVGSRRCEKRNLGRGDMDPGDAGLEGEQRRHSQSSSVRGERGLVGARSGWGGHEMGDREAAREARQSRRRAGVSRGRLGGSPGANSL